MCSWSRLSILLPFSNYPELDSNDRATALLRVAMFPPIWSRDRRAYVQRGQLKLQLNDYKGAIAEADQLIRQSPEEFPEAYDLRSAAKRKLGDEKGAIADQQKADKFYELYDQEEEE